MKRILIFAVLVVLAFSFAITVSASAQDAYSKINIVGENTNVEIVPGPKGEDWFSWYTFDPSQDPFGLDYWISWDGESDKSGYWIGGSSATDGILIKNVDFGTNEPKAIAEVKSSH